MWLQRTCLLFQLKYKEELDFELLSDCIKRLKGGKEFFINKAIGWSLRQHSKIKPLEVKTFLEKNPDLHPLSRREASKYL
jgi:3-methyladenine DNA glycosylase AlkD